MKLILDLQNMETTTKTTVTFTENENAMFQAFVKFYGMEQDENTNDYTKGCIQAANAIVPVLTKFMTHGKLNIEGLG